VADAASAPVGSDGLPEPRFPVFHVLATEEYEDLLADLGHVFSPGMIEPRGGKSEGEVEELLPDAPVRSHLPDQA
jgi:hypothetical protein